MVSSRKLDLESWARPPGALNISAERTKGVIAEGVIAEGVVVKVG